MWGELSALGLVGVAVKDSVVGRGSYSVHGGGGVTPYSGAVHLFPQSASILTTPVQLLDNR